MRCACARQVRCHAAACPSPWRTSIKRKRGFCFFKCGASAASTATPLCAPRSLRASQKRFPGIEIDIRTSATEGDLKLDKPLAELAAASPGLFTKELETWLLCGACDVAVHSLKDVPTQLPPGLAIAAISAVSPPPPTPVALAREWLFPLVPRVPVRVPPATLSAHLRQLPGLAARAP